MTFGDARLVHASGGAQVEVREDNRARPAQANAIDERSVIEGVGQDQVVGSEQSSEGPDVRRVPGGEEERRLRLEPLGQQTFDLEVALMGSAEQARCPGSRSLLFPTPRCFT